MRQLQQQQKLSAIKFFSLTKKQGGWIFVLALALPSLAASQTDTTLTTVEVEVSASRISRKSPGSFIRVLQKQALEQHQSGDLTGLLSGEAGLFFKTYGQGSLSTSSLRGGGASHTSILWNGFNLQNPMNGVADFSLFPVWLMDAVSVQAGGGSSLQGSGVLGGVVFIENIAPLEAGTRAGAGLSLGSFGERRQFGKLSLSGKHLAGNFNLIHQQAQNDFPIRKKGGLRQVDGAFEQWAFSQNNTLRINDKQKLETYAWWQKTSRQIPPSLTENNAHAKQEDGTLRLGADWTCLANQSLTKVRAGYFREDILFFSDLVDSAVSYSDTWIAELEQAFFWRGDQVLRAGLNLTRQTANTAESGRHDRSRLALFASWQRNFFNKKLNLSASARQEWVDEGFIPLVGSVGAEWRVARFLKFHSRLSKNFNLPTFNDLYWRDAFAIGNPALKPETAWGQELGFRIERGKGALHISSQLNFFNSLTKDWILWSPKGAIWQPENKRSVWARGLEHLLDFRYRGRDSSGLQASLRLSWSLTRSTVEKVYGSHDPTLLGKQLLYTPLFNGSAGAGLTYQTYFLSWQHIFTGRRFTTTDNSRYNALPFFQVSDLSLGKNWQFRSFHLRVQATVGNLFNTDYQAIASRPMPGRHFRLEAVCEFSGKKVP